LNRSNLLGEMDRMGEERVSSDAGPRLSTFSTDS